VRFIKRKKVAFKYGDAKPYEWGGHVSKHRHGASSGNECFKAYSRSQIPILTTEQTNEHFNKIGRLKSHFKCSSHKRTI